MINKNDIGTENNQTSVSESDREIPTLGSTDNAGNSVNLVSDITLLPSGMRTQSQKSRSQLEKCIETEKCNIDHRLNTNTKPVHELYRFHGTENPR